MFSEGPLQQEYSIPESRASIVSLRGTEVQLKQ